MRWVAALLAAVVVWLPLGGCGDDGAEPGAPRGATLVLDFTPNAVHSGIYAALARDYYRSAGVDLEVRQPGASTDGPKLLATGRADFAILDIHDLGIAREQGLDVVGVMPLVQRPLASLITRADTRIRRPRDLEGGTVGVTGLPSDDAVVDSEVAADGGDPKTVERVTIGFNAVASLAAGRVDAVTGFWNAEAVALRERGVPIRVFKLDDYGAPRYPELVLCTSGKTLKEDRGLVRGVVRATVRGYRFAVKRPMAALDDLLNAVPSLDLDEQAAQLHLLLPAFRPVQSSVGGDEVLAWGKWDVTHGILHDPSVVKHAFVDSGVF